MRGRGAQTWEEHFQKNVRIEECHAWGLDGDCWSWYGRTNMGGYGVAYIAGYSRLFHRLIWELKHGTIADKMELDHLCRNITCCNPDHLEPVTPEENQRRRTNPPYEKKTAEYFNRQAAEFMGRRLRGTAS